MASEYDQIARTLFTPAYPVIANQIRERTKIDRGRCLDAGCGGGYLGLELAKITNLEISLLDSSPEMVEIALRNISVNGLDTRMRTILADIHDIPMEDGSIDLVVSRGSVFFWEDQEKAFSEIHRILSPGGKAYIGGGFGSAELKNRIEAELERRNRDRGNTSGRKAGKEACGAFARFLNRAEVPYYEMKRDDSGFWIYFVK
jgi:ubiquinone/menaquinone biosynthesis C-methylase UbiE